MTKPARPGRFSRRSALAGGAGAAAGAALAGCSSRSSGAGGTSGGPLQVWGGVPEESGPAELIKGFKSKHSGTDVVYTRFVNDDRGNLKVDTALQGGVDIDVYFTYSAESLSLRSSSGLTLDLTDHVKQDSELKPYLNRSHPRAFWYDDAIHGLTTAREPHFVLINDDRRRAANADVPDKWTIDEYREYAHRLTTKHSPGAYTIPDLARIALGPDYWYTKSGNSNFLDPHFRKHLALGQQMIKSGSVYPWREVLARKLEAYQQNPFLNGDFAIWPTAPFNLRYLNDPENYPHDFTVSCAPVPAVPGSPNWDTGSFDNFVMINPKSRRKKLAWEFVRYWVTADGASAMLKGGKMPTLDVLDEDKVLSGLLGDKPERFFNVDSFRHVLAEQEPKLIVDSELTAYPEIKKAHDQQRDLCWLNEKSPAAAVKGINDLAQAAIDRYRKVD